MSFENIPISRRGEVVRKTGFLPFYLLTKKIIKNHEINENKMLKSQNVHKNKLYKIAILQSFQK